MDDGESMLSLGSSCSRLSQLLSSPKVWKTVVTRTEMKTPDEDQETFGSGVRDQENEVTAKTKVNLENLLQFATSVSASPATRLLGDLHETIVQRFPGHRYEDEGENEVWGCIIVIVIIVLIIIIIIIIICITIIIVNMIISTRCGLLSLSLSWSPPSPGMGLPHHHLPPLPQAPRGHHRWLPHHITITSPSLFPPGQHHWFPPPGQGLGEAWRVSKTPGREGDDW